MVIIFILLSVYLFTYVDVMGCFYWQRWGVGSKHFIT